MANDKPLSQRRQEEVRSNIRTVDILRRLTAFVMEETRTVGTGKKGETQEKPVQMTQAQVTAALGLLRKTLPDLSAMEVDNKPQQLPDATALMERIGALLKSNPELLAAVGQIGGVPVSPPPVASPDTGSPLPMPPKPPRLQ